MPSSTSPSSAAIHEGALPKGLRLTASDRPGQAQPVPVRDVPARPWVHMGLIAAAIALVLVAGWEVWARSFGLRTEDVGDSPQNWAAMRASVKPDDIVIVGDSRILFDTDLAHFERLTGIKPRQLAIHGTNGRPMLETMANDPTYHGLIIVGMADTSYFRPVGVGVGGPWLKDYRRNRQPSQISGLSLDRVLQGWLAFLDSDMRLSRLVRRLDHGWRAGVDSPYDDVWKVDRAYPDRQRYLWQRIEEPGYYQDQARSAWDMFKGKDIPPAVSKKVISRSREATRRIRARGGDVVFIRPPSSPKLRANEDKRLPRKRGFDALLAGVPAKGVHADDLGPNRWNIPEWSHLSRACSRVFTDMYVRRLATMTDRIKIRQDAPPPLAIDDCVGLGPDEVPAEGAGNRRS